MERINKYKKGKKVIIALTRILGKMRNKEEKVKKVTQVHHRKKL